MAGRVVGRYRLLSLLGRGGGGSVWRAAHVDLLTPAAIKLLDPSTADSPEALARFRREAKAVASVRSSHVVQLLDYGVDAGTPYIAMELLEGESLANRLHSRGCLSPGETAAILRQVAKALDRAHAQGIVHRDLKPDNVYLARDGDDEVVKLLDFGIAKSSFDPTIEDPLRTETGAILGTPCYMSPEQVTGEKTLDHRTDIWAFAVIACECLTGQRPFVANTFGALVLRISTGPPVLPSQLGSVPVGFDAWFARCTQRDTAQRYQSIRSASRRLSRLCDGESVDLVSGASPSSSPPSDRAEADTLPYEAVAASGPPVGVSGETPNSAVLSKGRHKTGMRVGARGVFAVLALAAAGIAVFALGLKGERSIEVPEPRQEAQTTTAHSRSAGPASASGTESVPKPAPAFEPTRPSPSEQPEHQKPPVPAERRASHPVIPTNGRDSARDSVVTGAATPAKEAQGGSLHDAGTAASAKSTDSSPHVVVDASPGLLDPAKREKLKRRVGF